MHPKDQIMYVIKKILSDTLLPHMSKHYYWIHFENTQRKLQSAEGPCLLERISFQLTTKNDQRPTMVQLCGLEFSD